jgi:hypothetical protein
MLCQNIILKNKDTLVFYDLSKESYARCSKKDKYIMDSVLQKFCDSFRKMIDDSNKNMNKLAEDIDIPVAIIVVVYNGLLCPCFDDKVTNKYFYNLRRLL